MNISKANEKFMRGDSITNAELSALVKAYTQLSECALLASPKFQMVRNDSNWQLMKLKSYVRARKERG